MADSPISASDKLLAPWDRSDQPGLAVAVIHIAETCYSRGLGVADLAQGIPITASTVFNAGSVSKQFTAFAALLLEREGRISLGDDIRDYLPELPAYETPIRIAHLMHHTSGLNEYLETLFLAGKHMDDMWETHEAMAAIRCQRTLSFRPGAEHVYSNSGYVLLAEIVARSSGKPFETFMQEQIFGPLGMTGSRFAADPMQVCENHARSYEPRKDGTFGEAGQMFGICGDGGLHTTASDLAKWLANFDLRSVGDHELFDRFFTPGHLGGGTKLKYAGGLEIEPFRGLHGVRHGGIFGGFRAHVLYIPNRQLAVAVLANRGDISPWPLADDLADIWLAGECPQMRRSVGHAPKIASHCEHFQGRYFTSFGTSIHIYERNGSLWAGSYWGDTPLWPDNESESAFLTHSQEEILCFEENDAGDIVGLRVSDKEERCPRLCSFARWAAKAWETMLTPSELSEFEGQYLNPELGAIYDITARGGKLLARHRRHDDAHLTPISFKCQNAQPDQFMGIPFWFDLVAFDRDEAGEVVGLRISGMRIRDIGFRKIA